MDRNGDADRLKRLYVERVPEGMSQEDFGKAFDIGNQSMVSQYLSGHRPLNFEAAAKFARGLRCTIADISPDLARRLRVEIIPMLGRVSVKAALVLGLGALLPGLSGESHASPFNLIRTGSFFASSADRVHIIVRWLLSLFIRRNAAAKF